MKISVVESEGLRIQKEAAKEFLDQEFPKAVIRLGCIATDNSYALRARIQTPCQHPLEDIEAGLDLVGIQHFEFVER